MIIFKHASYLNIKEINFLCLNLLSLKYGTVPWILPCGKSNQIPKADTYDLRKLNRHIAAFTGEKTMRLKCTAKEHITPDSYTGHAIS
jgi:hypothetical protein